MGCFVHRQQFDIGDLLRQRQEKRTHRETQCSANCALTQNSEDVTL